MLLWSPLLYVTTCSTAPISSPAPEPPPVSPSYVATVQQFACHLGLSRGVANQLSLCRRQSSRRLYQHCWECHRAWYAGRGHSVSSPTVSKIADFLLFLSVSAIKGYRSTLTLVFKYCLPEHLDSFILRDLISSFAIEHPHHTVVPPSWDLIKILEYLRASVFEPLLSKPLRLVAMKVSFLLALATAKRVGELQALSSRVVSRGPDLSCVLTGVCGQNGVGAQSPSLLFFGHIVRGFCWRSSTGTLTVSYSCCEDLFALDLDLVASPSVICFDPVSLACSFEEHLVVLYSPSYS